MANVVCYVCLISQFFFPSKAAIFVKTARGSGTQQNDLVGNEERLHERIFWHGALISRAVIPKVWSTVATLHLGPMHLYVRGIIEKIDR